ncbi:MAG: CRTAC1 family protein [Proteobacteria bacterium]|nr:CRTAC1 family protein [Pseudomonadota bacterium]
MRSFALAVATLLAALPALAETPPDGVKFLEETKTSGLDHTFSGEWEFMVGGGVASFDCNDDGFDDVFIAGGVNPSTFFRNASTAGGELKFVKEKSGLEVDWATGAYPLDIDSDGVKDLVVLRVGENLVMRGKGNCQFENANTAWGFDGGDGWSTAFAATWEKGAAWPTIAIGNYIDRKQESSPWGSCTDNWLHRPRAANEAGFAAPIALKPSFCPLSMLFSDWNRSGTPDLRVSNDREYYEGGQEQLWKIEAGQPPHLYTEQEGWQRLRIWGMGLASYDLDFDGYPEYFHTSMADNKLQTLAEVPKEGKPLPRYRDVAFKKGVTAHRPYMGTDLRPSTAWHTQFEDVNNDGLADLFIAKGNVWDMPDFAQKDPNNMFIQNADGTFHEAGGTSGAGSTEQSRGGILSDFNLDGLVDLLVVNRNSPAQLWRNTSSGTGHWVEVRLQQQGSNRDGIGAWLEIKHGEKIMRRELTSGGGHVSGALNWWHAGLGEMSEAELRVIWPDGEAGGWEKLAADRFYVISRGSPAKPWEPARAP